MFRRAHGERAGDAERRRRPPPARCSASSHESVRRRHPERQFLLIGGLVAIGAYFIPTFVAFARGHHHLPYAIFALDFLADWTFIGWVGSAGVVQSRGP